MCSAAGLAMGVERGRFTYPALIWRTAEREPEARWASIQGWLLGEIRIITKRFVDCNFAVVDENQYLPIACAQRRSQSGDFWRRRLLFSPEMIGDGPERRPKPM